MNILFITLDNPFDYNGGSWVTKIILDSFKRLDYDVEIMQLRNFKYYYKNKKFLFLKYIFSFILLRPHWKLQISRNLKSRNYNKYYNKYY